MRIANTAGWDTDCNAGNVGCLFGIRTGLAGLDAGPDFRTPIADRMYISSAEGGGSITDAVIEAQSLIGSGYALAEAPPPRARQERARAFNFNFSRQPAGILFEGWIAGAASSGRDQECPWSQPDRGTQPGDRLSAAGRPAGSRASRRRHSSTRTSSRCRSISSLACPTLYSGQTVECRLEADGGGTVAVRLYASVYDERDELKQIYGEARENRSRNGSGPDMALT